MMPNSGAASPGFPAAPRAAFRAASPLISPTHFHEEPENKSNAIFRATSRHGRDSGGGRKGRSDPRYLHDERRHSVEARQSQAPWTADVRGVGESKRRRLADPAKVSCGHGLGLALAQR